MAAIVYLLCTLISGLCALLLFRDYRRGRSRLLLWSGLSFLGWAMNNALVFADLIIWPTYDLTAVRAVAALVAVSLLLYGLIWDAV